MDVLQQASADGEVMAINKQASQPTDVFAHVRDALIGDHLDEEGPYGVRGETSVGFPTVGRSVSFVEDFVRWRVMPVVSQSIQASSSAPAVGVRAARAQRQATHLRDDARRIARTFVGAADSDIVVFTGTSNRDALWHFVDLLHMRTSDVTNKPVRLQSMSASPVVFVNSLEAADAWSNSVAQVVPIPYTSESSVNEDVLEAMLRKYSERPVKIGCLAATSASNGSGCDVPYISSLLHRYGALAVWDMSHSAPFNQPEMTFVPPESPSNLSSDEGMSMHMLDSADAVIVDPTKFSGGVSASAVLLVRKELFKSQPSQGMEVTEFVRYLQDVEVLEKSEASDLVRSVRAGLALQLRTALPVKDIRRQLIAAHRRAYEKLRKLQNVLFLNEELWDGSINLEETMVVDPYLVPCLCFVIRAAPPPPSNSNALIHHNLVATLCRDLFGIKLSTVTVDAFSAPFAESCGKFTSSKSRVAKLPEGSLRKGWCTMFFDPFTLPEVIDNVCKGIAFVASNATKFLHVYAMDSRSGEWLLMRPVSPNQVGGPSIPGGQATYDRILSVLNREEDTLTLQSISAGFGSRGSPEPLRKHRLPQSNKSPGREDRFSFNAYLEHARKLLGMLEGWGALLDPGDEMIHAEAPIAGSSSRWFVVGSDYNMRPRAPPKKAGQAPNAGRAHASVDPVTGAARAKQHRPPAQQPAPKQKPQAPQRQPPEKSKQFPVGEPAVQQPKQTPLKRPDMVPPLESQSPVPGSVPIGGAPSNSGSRASFGRNGHAAGPTNKIRRH